MRLTSITLKTCVTGHAQRVDDWYANLRTFWVPRWKTVIAGSILLEAFGVHYVLSSFESRNEVLKADLQRKTFDRGASFNKTSTILDKINGTSGPPLPPIQ